MPNIGSNITSRLIFTLLFFPIGMEYHLIYHYILDSLVLLNPLALMLLKLTLSKSLYHLKEKVIRPGFELKLLIPMTKTSKLNNSGKSLNVKRFHSRLKKMLLEFWWQIWHYWNFNPEGNLLFWNIWLPMIMPKTSLPSLTMDSCIPKLVWIVKKMKTMTSTLQWQGNYFVII